MMQQKLFFPRQTTSKDHKAENELQTPSASLARNRSRCQWQHPMFPRNTAIEMHVHASQESSEEPLYTEIFRKNAAAQNADIHFVQACAVEMHVHMSQASSEEPL